MDFAKKPETILSLAAVILAGGSAVYTNNKINALTQSLDKIIINVDAIGKKVGELRLSDLNDTKDQTKILGENLRKLDRFTYQLKNVVEEFQDSQQSDNESIQVFVNKLIHENELVNIEDLDLVNVEEVTQKKKSQKKKKNVRFVKREESSEDDDDDVSSKIDRMRKKRK